MQVGLVRDAQGPQVDQPIDTGRPHGGDDVPGALGVHEAQGLAAVPVARDRG